MPRPQRVSVPTCNTLATQFPANYSRGGSSENFSNATAARQSMRPYMTKAKLRQVADHYTAAVFLVDAGVQRASVPIAVAATDTVTNTAAGVAKLLPYVFVNAGTAFFRPRSLAVSALVNCTVTIDPNWGVTQPVILQDGSVVTNTSVAPAPGNVPVAGTLTANVTVTPTAAGAWSFSISTPTNEVSKDPYNWNVAGTAVAFAPEMDVFVGASPLASGGTDTIVGTTNGVPFPRTYTINNTGGDTLTMSAAIISAQVNCTAVVTTPAITPIPPFGTAPLVITVTPTIAGAFSFAVSKANNDSNENPYTWTGSGTAA